MTYHKEKERQTIQDQIDEFFKNGGEIKKERIRTVEDIKCEWRSKQKKQQEDFNEGL